MALGTIATIAAIAAAGTSIAGGVYAATRPTPTQPDGASSSREVALAQAGALPTNLQLQQLEQQGGRGSVNMPAHGEVQKVVEVTTGNHVSAGNLAGNALSAIAGGGPGIASATKPTREVVPYVESEWAPGGKYHDQLEDNGQAPWYYQNMPVAAGPEQFDFTGYGTADIEGKKARDQADLEIQLGKKYGVDFATQNRLLAEQADPLGTAARAKEYELMQQEQPVSPLAGQLNDQILAQVKAGRGLDPMSQALMEKSLAEANAARGGGLSAGDVTQSLSTGASGEARAQAAAAKGSQFLASGQTPEDIAFRRGQQQISNLGAFVAGQTPESQFGNISRSGTGATPTNPGQANATMPNNAGTVGNAFSNSAYQANVNQAQQTPSWLTGLSSLLSGIGSLNSATA